MLSENAPVPQKEAEYPCSVQKIKVRRTIVSSPLCFGMESEGRAEKFASGSKGNQSRTNPAVG
jgi:hypothetical protein